MIPNYCLKTTFEFMMIRQLSQLVQCRGLNHLQQIILINWRNIKKEAKHKFVFDHEKVFLLFHSVENQHFIIKCWFSFFTGSYKLRY